MLYKSYLIYDINMIEYSFYNKIKAHLQQNHPKIKIDINLTPFVPYKQPFSILDNPTPNIQQLSWIFDQLDQLDQSGSLQKIESIKKIMKFLTNSIRILENNQECRVFWLKIIDRSKSISSNNNKMHDIQAQKAILQQILEQCKYGVTSKTSFLKILTDRSKYIFLEQQKPTQNPTQRNPYYDRKLQKEMKQIILTGQPYIFQVQNILSDENYQLAYRTQLEEIKKIHGFLEQYAEDYQQGIQKSIKSQYFQPNHNFYSQKKKSIIRYFQTNSSIKKLIDYTWNVCNSRLQQYNKLSKKIFNLRNTLKKSILKTYYLCFISKNDLNDLYNNLKPIENYLIHSINPIHEENGFNLNLGRNSLIKEVNEDKIIELQVYFQKIFMFLTEQSKQTIFVRLYDRKISKRMYKINEIQIRLIHLLKLKFNPDYAENFLMKNRQRQQYQALQMIFQEKFQKLVRFYEQTRPMSRNQCRMMFEDLQRILAQRESHRFGSLKDFQYEKSFQQRILHFQRKIINEYLSTETMNSHLKKSNFSHNKSINNVNHNLSKSNVSLHSSKTHNNNLQKIKRQQLFGQSLQQLKLSVTRNTIPNRLSSPAKAKTNSINLIREANQFIKFLNPQVYSQELNDMSNFKAYMLIKISNDVETALLDKMDMDINRNGQNIKINGEDVDVDEKIRIELRQIQKYLGDVMKVIRTDIDQDKIGLVFYPRVDGTLFSALKAKIKEYYTHLNTLSTIPTPNSSPHTIIHPNLHTFIQSRLLYLKTILQTLDKIEQIISFFTNTIYNSLEYQNKNSYEITSQGTYDHVLKLVLIEKQIKSYLIANQDSIHYGNLSKKGLTLMNQKVLKNFVRSLNVIFKKIEVSGQKYNRSVRKESQLQYLLKLCEKSIQILPKIQNTIQTLLSISQQILNKKISRNIIEMLQTYNITLSDHLNELNCIIQACRGFEMIGSQQIQRERLKVYEIRSIAQEFINGIATRKDRKVNGQEILDENAKRFKNILEKIVS